MSSTPRKIASEALSWLKTPHAYFERTKGEEGGVDCLNLPAACLVAAGAVEEDATWSFLGRISIDDYLEAGYDLLTRELERALDDGLVDGQVYETRDLEDTVINEGDILLLKTSSHLTYPNHAAVAVSRGLGPFVVHALEENCRGRVARTPLPKHWIVTAIYRFR